MYIFNAEELRSIHEERVGHLKSLYSAQPKHKPAPARKPRKGLFKWLKRDDS